MAAMKSQVAAVRPPATMAGTIPRRSTGAEAVAVMVFPSPGFRGREHEFGVGQRPAPGLALPVHGEGGPQAELGEAWRRAGGGRGEPQARRPVSPPPPLAIWRVVPLPRCAGRQGKGP